MLSKVLTKILYDNKHVPHYSPFLGSIYSKFKISNGSARPSLMAVKTYCISNKPLRSKMMLFLKPQCKSFVKHHFESMFHDALNFCRRLHTDSNSVCIQYGSHDTQIKKMRMKVGSHFTKKHSF